MLVSALGWDGPERRVYELVRQGRLELGTSLPLLDELRRVLRYPKLELGARERRTFVRDVRAHGRLVSPNRGVDLVEVDPADNRVLECAVAARVDWIVSGDRDLLEFESFEDIPIVTAAQLLRILGVEGD